VRTTNLIAIFGGILILVGLWLGFAPLEATGGQDCGSPFASRVAVLETAGGFAQLGNAYNGRGSGDNGFHSAATECREQIASTKPIAILLLAMGCAALLTGLLGNRRASGPRLAFQKPASPQSP